jgi:hypothetical protein
MQTLDLHSIVMGIALIGFSTHLLYVMKAFKILIVWSVLLMVTEMAIVLLGYDVTWGVLFLLPFFLFAVTYMMIKDRLRINEILKQIDKREKEEAREARKEKIRTGAAEMAQLYRSDPELKELNAFVGDFQELPSQSDFVLTEKSRMNKEELHGN